MLLSRKLKNSIQIQNINLECSLKNILINGDKRGCSGFIRNPKNGKIVYVNTEKSCLSSLNNSVLWRYAEHMKDYTGKQNHFCEEKDLATTVAKALA